MWVLTAIFSLPPPPLPLPPTHTHTHTHTHHTHTTQLGPNADVKKWEEEQMDIATVRFGARDAKEKSKVRGSSGGGLGEGRWLQVKKYGVIIHPPLLPPSPPSRLLPYLSSTARGL